MNAYIISGIAVALAMDAFAVSIAAGVCLEKLTFRNVFRLSWHFGFFQAMMPVIGWFVGLAGRSYIEAYDHWVAFGLLAFVGLSMAFEVIKSEDNKCFKKDPTKGASLVILSVATSIDALAVGLSLSVLKISIVMPVTIIGITALLFTSAGLYIGNRLGSVLWLSKYAGAAGALILFLTGLKILYDHGALGV